MRKPTAIEAARTFDGGGQAKTLGGQLGRGGRDGCRLCPLTSGSPCVGGQVARAARAPTFTCQSTASHMSRSIDLVRSSGVIGEANHLASFSTSPVGTKLGSVAPRPGSLAGGSRGRPLAGKPIKLEGGETSCIQSTRRRWCLQICLSGEADGSLILIHAA